MSRAARDASISSSTSTVRYSSWSRPTVLEFLVPDDVGAGKTIEACLVPKDPQARKRAMIFSKRLVIDGMWRNERKRLDEDSRTWTTSPGIAAR